MKLRVIGWANYDYCKLKRGRSSWAVRMAVIDEIIKNNYLFSGEDHQEGYACAPVLNDGKVYIFSQRGFADMMAEAHGYTGLWDYAGFMFGLKRELVKTPDERINERNVVAEKNLNETFTMSVDKEKFDTANEKLEIEFKDLLELRYIDYGDTLVLDNDGNTEKYTVNFVERKHDLIDLDEMLDKARYSHNEKERDRAIEKVESSPLKIVLKLEKAK